MNDIHQEAKPPVQGIGGWLLFFIVMVFLKTVSSLISEYRELSTLFEELPEMTTSGYAMYAIECLWGGTICYALLLLIQVKKNAIKFIKIVLLINPVLNALLPLGVMLALKLSYPQVEIFTGEIVGGMYDGPVWGNILGSCIGTLIWYKYFSVSVRVQNTWGKYESVAQEQQIL